MKPRRRLCPVIMESITTNPQISWPIILLVGLVAAFYSSVGHGGASGYLAVLSLCGFQPAFMSSTALVLNTIVASISAISYIKAKHFRWSLCWPFIVTSIPAAYIGGRLHVESGVYFILLALTLSYVAIRLLVDSGRHEQVSEERNFTLKAGFSAGAGIGFLSGIVGIGGGVFLTPLILLMRWSDAKSAAAVSAVFIVVNSISGLAARNAISSSMELNQFSPLIIAAFIGGLLGAQLGANKFSQNILRRVLAIVLLIAAFKLVVASGIFSKI